MEVDRDLSGMDDDRCQVIDGPCIDRCMYCIHSLDISLAKKVIMIYFWVYIRQAFVRPSLSPQGTDPATETTKTPSGVLGMDPAVETHGRHRLAGFRTRYQYHLPICTKNASMITNSLSTEARQCQLRGTAGSLQIIDARDPVRHAWQSTLQN